MELLRYTRNAWGQEVLEGVSLELLPVFAGLGVLLILGHLIYKRVSAARRG